MSIIIKGNQDTYFDPTSVFVYKRFDESSLSRVIQHCQRGFMAISSDRGELKHEDGTKYTDEELAKANIENRKKLENDLRRNGLGYISTLGGYGELLPNGDKRFVDDEHSKFVPYPGEDKMSFEQFRNLGIELAKKYQQDSVLIAEPVKDNDGNTIGLNAAYWEHPNENDWNYKQGDLKFTNIGFDKMPDYYSKLKKGSHAGRKFNFKEEAEKDLDFELWGYRAPASHNGRIKLTSLGEILYNPTPEKACKFTETAEDRDLAVYANDKCRKWFLDNCLEVESDLFIASEAVDEILNNTPIDEAVKKATKIKKGSGNKIECEDDLVVVYDAETGEEVYSGTEDYEGMKDGPWKWDDILGAYRLEDDVNGKHYSYIKNRVG